jgi:hypothetical protein
MEEKVAAIGLKYSNINHSLCSVAAISSSKRLPNSKVLMYGGDLKSAVTKVRRHSNKQAIVDWNAYSAKRIGYSGPWIYNQENVGTKSVCLICRQNDHLPDFVTRDDLEFTLHNNEGLRNMKVNCLVTRYRKRFNYVEIKWQNAAIERMVYWTGIHVKNYDHISLDREGFFYHRHQEYGCLHFHYIPRMYVPGPMGETSLLAHLVMYLLTIKKSDKYEMFYPIDKVIKEVEYPVSFYVRQWLEARLLGDLEINFKQMKHVHVTDLASIRSFREDLVAMNNGGDPGGKLIAII